MGRSTPPRGIVWVLLLLGAALMSASPLKQWEPPPSGVRLGIQSTSRVNLVLFVDASSYFCQEHVKSLSRLHRKLQYVGIDDIHFTVINAGTKKAMENRELLGNNAGNLIVVQDGRNLTLWRVMEANKSDVFIYDRCSRLSFHIPMPLSFPNRPYTKQAIISTYLQDLCGPWSQEQLPIQKQDFPGHLGNVSMEEDLAEHLNSSSINATAKTEQLISNNATTRNTSGTEILVNIIKEIFLKYSEIDSGNDSIITKHQLKSTYLQFSPMQKSKYKYVSKYKTERLFKQEKLPNKARDEECTTISCDISAYRIPPCCFYTLLNQSPKTWVPVYTKCKLFKKCCSSNKTFDRSQEEEEEDDVFQRIRNPIPNWNYYFPFPVCHRPNEKSCLLLWQLGFPETDCCRKKLKNKVHATQQSKSSNCTEKLSCQDVEVMGLRCQDILDPECIPWNPVSKDVCKAVMRFNVQHRCCELNHQLPERCRNNIQPDIKKVLTSFHEMILRICSSNKTPILENNNNNNISRFLDEISQVRSEKHMDKLLKEWREGFYDDMQDRRENTTKTDLPENLNLWFDVMAASTLSDWFTTQWSSMLKEWVSGITSSWSNLTDWFTIQWSSELEAWLSGTTDSWSSLIDWFTAQCSNQVKEWLSGVTDSWSSLTDWFTAKWSSKLKAWLSGVTDSWSSLTDWFTAQWSNELKAWLNGIIDSWSSLTDWFTTRWSNELKAWLNGIRFLIKPCRLIYSTMI